MKKLLFVGLSCLLVGAGVSYGVTQFALDRNKVTPPKQTNSTQTVDPDSKIAKLRKLKGSAFDKEYISQLMENGQDAIAVAELAEGRTEREEINKWSQYVIKTGPNDINILKSWYSQWGFKAEDVKNNPHTH